jgi:hypothetical protein
MECIIVLMEVNHSIGHLRPSKLLDTSVLTSAIVRRIQVDMMHPPVPPSVIELLSETMGTQRVLQEKNLLIEEINQIQAEVNEKRRSVVSNG